MPRSARDYVNSLASSQANSNARPNAAEPTGNNERIGLYDLPPDDPRSREHVDGPRQPRPTEGNIAYRATRDRAEQQRRRSNDTRARNASLPRVRVQEPASQQGEPNRPTVEVAPSTTQHATQRGRSRAIRRLSHSPSPGSTDCEQERPSQPQGGSQYTYKYETLDHEGLVNCAQEEFGLDVRGCDTQTIIDRIRFAAAEQASSVGPARRPASIVLLPPTPFQVGGGWSQSLAGGSQPTSPSKKRPSDAADVSEGSSKRQRKEFVVDDDTATESETDDDVDLRPVQPRPQVPPPSHESTPATVLDFPPSNASSHSLGGSLTHSPVCLPSPLADQPSVEAHSKEKPREKTKLPRLIAPLTGPVHSRLRNKVADRALDDIGSGLDEVPETEFGSSPTQNPNSNTRTYRGRRSHVLTESGMAATKPTDAENATHDRNRLNSPHLTTSQLIQRERARAVAAKAQQEMAEIAPRRRPLVLSGLQPPASRSQPRPPPQAGRASVQRAGGTSRRLDPVSAARQDMLAFNRAVAQGEATSFIESVTRQSERTARCAPPVSRPADDLLDDNEEMLAQAEAYAKHKWPPLARDVSGLARQVLTMAKIHLFAYALVEGIYQTRATYLRWAALIHQATWQMELPEHPYETPDNSIFEIMVNSIATARGKVKERLREFSARVAGFRHTTTNQKVIERNLVRFNRVYPNSHHCKTTKPRSGDYESSEIGHGLALGLFYGPNSVGVLYPDYFRDMPLTVVAFVLAIWQFCIEEWANGWRENGDLGMSAMRDKYEAQLSGLKELREVAPRRLHRLQNEWIDYVTEYSGAAFEPEEDAAPTRKSQMRPDTPDPDTISVEEMDAQLLETARQNSLRSRMEELAAHELAQPMDVDEDDLEESQVSLSHSPSPVLAEYNEHGVLTARSKGKGRAE